MIVWLIIFIFTTVLFLGVSIFLFIFNRYSVHQLYTLLNEIDQVYIYLDEYREHLRTVLSMSVYSDEPIIKNMLKHTKAVTKTVEEIRKRLETLLSEEDIFGEEEAQKEEE